MSVPYPNLLVVGAPKAGTTSLCAQLNMHPQIMFHPRKETQFFADDLTNGPDHERWKRDPELCFAAFRGRTERYLGDGSTWHLFSRNAARRIAAVRPEARIVICLRHPVELVHSLYHYRIAEGIIRPGSLESYLERERGLAGADRVAASSVFMGVARYHDQVRRYAEAFPRRQIHFVLYDDYRACNQREVERTLDFLGLEPIAVPPTRLNPTRPKRSLGFARLIAWRPPVVRKLAYALPKPVRSGLYRRLDGLNTTNRRPPPLPAELRRRLALEFEGELGKLEALLGRDLAHWRAA